MLVALSLFTAAGAAATGALTQVFSGKHPPSLDSPVTTESEQSAGSSKAWMLVLAVGTFFLLLLVGSVVAALIYAFTR